VHWSSLWCSRRPSRPRRKARRVRPGSPSAPHPPSSPPRSAPATTRTLFLPRRRPRSSTRRSGQPFVFAIRSTATYEHVYYGRDGTAARAYLRSVVHRTAFAYRIVNGENAAGDKRARRQPADVTDDEHAVEGVPTGRRRCASSSRSCGTRLTTTSRDTSARQGAVGHAGGHRRPQDGKRLPVMPYRSADQPLYVPKPVQVRGFPLGAFAAVNTGQGAHPMTHDSERGLEPRRLHDRCAARVGEQRQPVFAVSCRTAEPELCGSLPRRIYDAAALNAVVATNQLRDELDTLKVPKRDSSGAAREITAQGPRQAGQAAPRRAHPQP